MPLFLGAFRNISKITNYFRGVRLQAYDRAKTTRLISIKLNTIHPNQNVSVVLIFD